MSVSPSQSLTIWGVEQVTALRNEQQSSVVITGVKRVVAELTYLAMPVVALVESVARGAIALIAKLITYVLPEGLRDRFHEQVYAHLAAGSIGSAAFGMISIACVFQNLYKPKIDLPELVNQTTPCLTPNSG